MPQIIYATKPCKVYSAPFDVRLPDEEEADDEVRTVVQPDILVVCDESKLDEAFRRLNFSG